MSSALIPQWAGAIASRVVTDFGHNSSLLEGAIAAALVIERERCAGAAKRRSIPGHSVVQPVVAGIVLAIEGGEP